MKNYQQEIIEALKAYLEARHVVRMRPEGFSSVHRKTPEYEEYRRLTEIEADAYSKLWRLTDREYDEDGFRNFMWEWRYWKVMGRKCCWYQRDSANEHHLASETMRKSAEAEERFVEACGLTEIYEPATFYIENAFPNLKPMS